MKLKLLASALTVCLSMTAHGGENTDSVRPLRPVAAAYTIEIGSAHLADTYLTPLKYTGQHFALAYERLQAMRHNPERNIMQLRGSLGLNHCENPARNATMWDLAIDLSWSMMWRYDIASVSGLRLAWGGNTGLRAGAMYLARNGNNPVAAKGAWTIGLTGMATYNLRLGRLPVTLRYQPTLPLTGVFFSPDYGELYYEIYLGNHSGLVHAAWPGNYFRLDNLLTADLRFGDTALRIGYHGDIFSSKVNNIVTRRFTHTLSIGVSGEWLSLGRNGCIDRRARIISALY